MLDHVECRVAVVGADVDPLLVQFGRLAVLVLGDDVGGLAADDAVDRPLRAVDDEVPPREQLPVDAADDVERHIPVLVDVGDDETDLVAVPGDEHVRGAVGRHLGPHVAQGVARGSPP